MDAVAPLLAGVDRAVLVATLTHRLRAAGVSVGMTSSVALVDALEAAPPSRLRALYWTVRVTLVDREQDLATFDEVFRAVFEDALLPVDPHARRRAGEAAPPSDDAFTSVRGRTEDDESGDGLPWHTLPRHRATDDHGAEEDVLGLPERLASAVARIADTPLDELDEDEVALLGRWLEEHAQVWPTRRSRRQRVARTGQRVALRETLAASRRTGWEPVEIRRHRPVRRPLPVTLLCDVSESMQAFSVAYLHLMRALARGRDAETFVFSTSLTRLTPSLRLASPTAAIAHAEEQVPDRYGGTHLATCLRELLRSRHAGGVRGGILVIASDGWDSDPPEALAAAMARAARRARRVVWLNPRSAQPGYRPLVGPMAAALPYCDAFLPADTVGSLTEVLDALVGVSSRG